MIALVGAMFVAMGSARGIEFGTCAPVGSGATEAVNYLTVGDSCTVEHPNTNTDDDDDWSLSANGIVQLLADVSSGKDGGGNDQTTNLGIRAQHAGSVTVTDPGTDGVVGTGDDDVVYKFMVRAAPSISISFEDTDQLVSAGTPVMVTVTTTGISADHTVRIETPAPTYFTSVDANGATDNDEVDDLTTGTLDTSSQFVNVTHELLTGDTEAGTAPPAADHKYVSRAIISTSGVAAGEYTVTATVTAGATAIGNLAAGRTLSDTEPFRVGDPGAGLASAKLGAANVDASGMPTTDGSGSADMTTKAAGSTIHLQVSSANSLGAKANKGDVDQVIVFAIGGYIDGDTAKVNGETFREESGMEKVGAVQAFSVTRSTPGTVTVRATVVGSGTNVATNELVLTFTGDAEEIALGEPSNQLGQKASEIKVEVTASDDAGNTAEITPIQLSSRLLDADGNAAKNVFVKETMQKVDDKGDDDASNDTPVSTAVVVTLETRTAAAADAGTYTLEVKLGSEDTKTVDFIVAGSAANVAVEVDSDEVEVGDVVTVTATITDADGHPVVDDDPGSKSVKFSSAGALELRGFGAVDGVVSQPVKDGVATAKFVVAKGEGKAVILVDHGSATGTTAVSTAASEPEAMPEEEAGLSCISSLSGFSTWTCDVEASASEIFDWISSRGATALHLNSNRMWVRYSVVDGAMVPGSSDFMVTKSDILYISN